MKIIIPDSVKDNEIVGYVKGIFSMIDIERETELQFGRCAVGKAFTLQIPFAGPDANFWKSVGSIKDDLPE